ncbi:MAG: ribonuclease HII [Candidatus Kerfeldbacteria bacterium]
MEYPTKREENKLFKQGYKYVAGIDEAGRGAWAGPLVAAAVILPKDFKLKGLNDSKKLSAKQRDDFFTIITKNALAYYACIIPSKEIDKGGVGKANLLAIKKSAEGLKIKPDYILIDSFKVTWNDIPAKSITKGDTKVIAIAAASVIAKVTRDRIMVQYHNKFPKYGFDKHKGYGTKEHHNNLKSYGITPIHRQSYQPIKELM